MDTISMKSENSKTSKLHVLILKLTSATTWNDLNDLNLNCLMNRSLHQIFKIILKTFNKSMEKILITHQHRYM